MKKSLSGVFVVLAWLALPTLVAALEAPLILTHQLTSSHEGSATVTRTYLVYLQNPGDSGLSNLELALVPLPPFLTRELVLNLAFLGPHETAQLEVALVAPKTPGAEAVAYAALRFAGTCRDAQGQPIEFPVTSHPRLTGGVK